MKRKTLIVSILGALGLLAVWYFVLRKSTAADATDETLQDALDSGSTAATGSTTTGGGSDLLTSFGGQLDSVSNTLAALATKVETTLTPKEKTWVRTAQGDVNLWTNRETGSQQTLLKGHNPNSGASLTESDRVKLATAANEPFATQQSAIAPTPGGSTTARTSGAIRAK